VRSGLPIGLLVLLGCTGDPQPPPEPPPVILGAFFEADREELGQAAIALANVRLRSAGGLLEGRRVEVRQSPFGIGMGDPSEATRDLLDEGAVVIVGPFDDPGVVFVVQEQAYLAQVPVITPFPMLEELFALQPAGDGYLFFLSPRVQAPTATFAGELIARGCTKLAVVAYPGGVGFFTRYYAPAYEAGAGTEVIGMGPPGAWDDTTFIRQLQAEAPDCIAPYATNEDNARLIRAWYDQPGAPPVRVVTGHGHSRLRTFIDSVGDRMRLDGMLVLSDVELDLARPEYMQFRQELFGLLRPDYGDPEYAYVAAMYDAIMLAVLAVQRQGEVLPGPELRDALLGVARGGGGEMRYGPENLDEALIAARQGETLNYEGASSDLDFSDQGFVERPRYLLQYDAAADEFDRLGAIE
jgi:hypothetical protein